MRPEGPLSASVGNGTTFSADALRETILLCGRENPRDEIEMGALVPQVSGNRLVKIYTRAAVKGGLTP